MKWLQPDEMLSVSTHDDLLTVSVGSAVSKILTFLVASAEEINIQVRGGMNTHNHVL